VRTLEELVDAKMIAHEDQVEMLEKALGTSLINLQRLYSTSLACSSICRDRTTRKTSTINDCGSMQVGRWWI
jgi:hypothetical protein